MTATMNKRERVMAAIEGRPVDRVPVSFWLHNFAQEHSARALADETERLYRAFDWDFLKPQSRATCFAEMWGLQITPSLQRAVPFGVRTLPCRRPEDFGDLAPADASTGALGEQLEALLEIRRRVGPEPPIVSTIFAPMMTATFMMPGGRDAVMALMRDHPDVLDAGLAAVGRTLADYARNCVQAGLDGVFFATTVATRPLMSVEQCRRFQRTHDLPILQAAAGAPFNIMHVCQDDTHFAEFADYPVSVFSWATTPGNPTLAQARNLTGKAVLGGLPAKPEIGRMTAAELVAHAHRAIAETGGRHHLLGPGCSINPDTPDALMHAVGEAVAG